MKIATWNIAGIKARLQTLINWLKVAQPDVVCLQETKSVNERFPREELEDLGYTLAIHGQKAFNGVAILSKTPLEDIRYGLPTLPLDMQARFIEAGLSWRGRSLRIASLYVPNGNPVYTEKYAYKLQWMQALYDFVRERLSLEEAFILAGDFNVIATPIDAKNIEEWRDDALYLPETRQHFLRLKNLRLVDSIRALTTKPSFTFWDFQAGAWRKNNGIRIDYILLSVQAAKFLKASSVQSQLRGWEKPSDHVPVCIELFEDPLNTHIPI